MAMATADNDEAMLAGPDEMKTEMGSSIGDVEASALWATAAAAGGVDDAQAARLEVLAGLVAGIDDKVRLERGSGGVGSGCRAYNIFELDRYSHERNYSS